MQYSFVVGSRSVPYVVRRSTRARRVRLVVWPERGLEVVVPARFPLRDLPPILAENGAWVIARLDDAAKHPPAPQPVFETGTQTAYLGDEYTLNVVRETRRGVAATPEGSTLMLRLPPNTDVQTALETWYKAQALAYIPARVAQIAAQIGAPVYNGVTVRAQKTRWGSCSSRKHVSFNWRLIMTPPAITDYVIIHELTHLRHPNHAPAFWQAVAAHCPDYKTRRDWLKANGPRLWQV